MDKIIVPNDFRNNLSMRLLATSVLATLTTSKSNRFKNSTLFQSKQVVKNSKEGTVAINQTVDDMIEAIGLPRVQLCLYCWTGECPGSPNVKNKAKKVKFNLIFFNLVKYLLISAGLFYILRYVPLDLFAFFIGISFVQLVMVTKISSIFLVNFVNKSIKVDVKKRAS